MIDLKLKERYTEAADNLADKADWQSSIIGMLSYLAMALGLIGMVACERKSWKAGFYKGYSRGLCDPAYDDGNETEAEE